MPADLTPAHVRAAYALVLTHPNNPAILRLPTEQRTVEGVARAYLPRGLWVTEPKCGWTGFPRPRMYWRWDEPVPETAVLDLTDPGTVRALPVLLALALGLDSGVMGLRVSWDRYDDTGYWCLSVSLRHVEFCSVVYAQPPEWLGRRKILAPTIATEPDPIRALTLALLHVLEAPCSTP